MTHAAGAARLAARSEAYWAAGFALSVLLHSSMLLLRSGPPASPADRGGKADFAVSMRWTSPQRDSSAPAAAEVARVSPPAAVPVPAAVPRRAKIAAPKARRARRPPPSRPRSARQEPSKSVGEAAPQPASEEVAGKAGAGVAQPRSASAPAARPPASASWIEPLLAELRRLLEAQKRYPRIARRRGQEGTVVLRAVLTSRGEVRRWEVAEPSRHRALDEAALEAAEGIRRLGLGEPGGGDDEVTVVVPLRFSLRGGG
jgi:protein TonB